jgi:DnaK suppressor protein
MSSPADRPSVVVPELAARVRADLEQATARRADLEQEYEALLSDPGVIQEDRDATRLLLEGAREAEAVAQRAVERLDAGTYGRCASCGGAVEVERLEAVPEADTCMSCAS